MKTAAKTGAQTPLFGSIQPQPAFGLRREPTEEETLRAIFKYFESVYPDGPPPILSDEEEIARAITGEEFINRMRVSIHKYFESLK